MKKIGLALSGGGFRASLYHLGLVRFLRDAGILPQVTHITSVSGGSILAAHLVLNWDRYNGSPNDFDAAAAELLNFIRFDIRNRIVRRFPLSFLIRWPRRLLGLSNRKLSRTGLLEYYYQTCLYGDISLFQLRQKPELHILATNLSEGCLCSFNRNGLWIMRRQPGHHFRIDKVHVGLATVPMAVTASSAFPGFFPPVELTGADVGSAAGEFGRQAYTDGGVFDNLGVRMFRFLEPELQDAGLALDGVLVSDVGKKIDVRGSERAGGVIRTAMRSTDILMDRVWQLESDTFEGTPGFVFAPFAEVVEAAEDPTAIHPELQRQVARIRTDLDRFSPLEVSSLVRHGYCVGRKACKTRPDLFGADLPQTAPWDPVPAAEGAAPAVTLSAPVGSALVRDRAGQSAAPATVQARILQKSSVRRIWSRFFDFRDWMSYVYVPIIVPILFLLPYYIVKAYQRSARMSALVDSLSHGSRDLEVMSRLLDGPMTHFTGETAEQMRAGEALDLKDFEVLQDSRIIDMRAWNPLKDDTESLVYGFRRLKVFKKDELGNQIFRIGALATHPKTDFRFPPQDLKPILRKMEMEPTPAGEKRTRFEVSVDFSKAPAGEFFDVMYEHLSPGVFLKRGDTWSSIIFGVEADTAEVTRWLLLPRGKEYKSFRIVRWETGKPETVQAVRIVTEYLANDSTILAYKLLSVKGGYTYEVTWFYK